jgi:hypothetical protein
MKLIAVKVERVEQLTGPHQWRTKFEHVDPNRCCELVIVTDTPLYEANQHYEVKILEVNA